MPRNASILLGPAIPQLPSGNLDLTASFFQQLGFAVAGNFPTQGFLIMQRDEAELHFWLADSEDQARHFGGASSCYIRVVNVDQLAAEFGEEGISTRYGPIDQPWGMREMQIDDPYGNAIRFGEELNPGTT
ncbi:VOC family protein [Viridibacterium curvum]|uniref:Bleomycin resistance protein n=1 Tax=Viridibacterium curvum TaxID=1101404 RepID=A0ABP9QHP0_9RHOO